LLIGLVDAEQERHRAGVAGLAGAGVAETGRLGNPAGALDEDLALALIFWNQYPIESDVGDDHAVGKIIQIEAHGATVTVTVEAVKPGGTLLMSTRTGPSNPSIRSILAVKACPMPGGIFASSPWIETLKSGCAGRMERR